MAPEESSDCPRRQPQKRIPAGLLTGGATGISAGAAGLAVAVPMGAVLLAAVRRERALLEAACSAIERTAALGEAIGALATVNETLWDIEGRIREHERDGRFDDGFVELARAVYVTPKCISCALDRPDKTSASFTWRSCAKPPSGAAASLR